MVKNKICRIHGETPHSLRKDKCFRCLKCGVEAVSKRRRVIKLKAIEYKGGCCNVCGYSKCVGALEFHHTEPGKKDFTISAKGVTRAWKTVQAELDKCLLLCANCHRELHAELY